MLITTKYNQRTLFDKLLNYLCLFSIITSRHLQSILIYTSIETIKNCKNYLLNFLFEWNFIFYSLYLGLFMLNFVVNRAGTIRHLMWLKCLSAFLATLDIVKENVDFICWALRMAAHFITVYFLSKAKRIGNERCLLLGSFLP